MDVQFIPTVFFTLFFVVDPLGLIPVFLVYLAGYRDHKRKRIIIRSIGISIAVSVFFILFGRYLLGFLGISTGSFLVAGGILLFIISMEMLLGQASRIKMRDIGDHDQPEEERDVSVFPLAIPMLCGPGNIAALVMFSTEAQGDIIKLGIIVGVSVMVFLMALVVMFFSDHISDALGATGISITQKLMGLILSAMSVQFIRNGLFELGIIR
ncbi:MAG: MarC family protein [Spirochaetes bacterium]|nr:MarC family protein [Spirochaetota bacterium]